MLLLCGCLLACEKSIEVSVPEEPPRLVVEALIRVDTSEAYLPIAVKLSETAPFFGEIQPVTDVEEMVILIQVFDEDGVSSGTGTSVLGPSNTEEGVYVPVVIPGDVDERIPMSLIESDVLYTLVITWRGRRYAAQTRYVAAVPIEEARFGVNTLIDEDKKEVIVRIQDPPEFGNYYVFDFGEGEFIPSEDIFYNGQSFEFSYFLDRTLPEGSDLEVGILGADQVLHNYILLLAEQSGVLENPFQVPVATVRGNVFDVTELDNVDTFDNAGEPEVFPLGFFAIVQEFTYTINAE
jgi:hypothetical protein